MLVKTLQNLSIPEQTDIIFVSPESSKWHRLLAQNKSLTGNLPNRDESRRELLALACSYTKNVLNLGQTVTTSDNIIATGHQPGWHHCGLWVKDLAACKFAKAVMGCGLHLIVDHDICDTAIVLPGQNANGRWFLKNVELEDRQQPVGLEFRRPPDKTRIRDFLNTVINTQADQFCSAIWSECSVLNQDQDMHFGNIAALITYLEAVLNAALGLKILYLPVSRLAQSDAFLSFAASVVTGAGHFAAAYNKAITEQINHWKITARQTVQALSVYEKPSLIELPFWLLRPNGTRTLLNVVPAETYKAKILADSAELGTLDSKSQAGRTEQLKKILRQSGCRLRPKAVTLTLFVRLFLADWFVHGIGGARYEYITDRIIEHYYRIKGLGFGIATTTVTLPLPGCGEPTTPTAELKQKLRNLKYNPEKHIDASLQNKEPVKSLLSHKKHLVETTRNRSLSAEDRKAAWDSTSRVNKKLFRFAENSLQEAEKTLKLLENQEALNKVRSYREYFFGLFPEKSLCNIMKSSIFQKNRLANEQGYGHRRSS